DPATALYQSGSEVEWRVRTKGQLPNWSVYSAVATFSIVTKPIATIIYPTTTHNESGIKVEWGYAQADGHPQSGWEIEFLRDGVRVRSASGTSPSQRNVTFAQFMTPGVYTVRLRVREQAGFWSDWASTT